MGGDQVALMQQLHDEHAAALWGYCVRLTGHDRARAEDVVQETMLRAWRHFSALDESQGSVRAWLFTVARNIVIDDWRSRRVHGETALSALPELAGPGRPHRRAAAVLDGRRGAHEAQSRSPGGAAGVLLPGRSGLGGGPATGSAGGNREVAHPLRAARAPAGAGGDGGRRMTCEYTHLDGAYLLGALAPGERQEFEAHLRRLRRVHPGGRRARRAAGPPGPGGARGPRQPDERSPVPESLLPGRSSRACRVPAATGGRDRGAERRRGDGRGGRPLRDRVVVRGRAPPAAAPVPSSSPSAAAGRDDGGAGRSAGAGRPGPRQRGLGDRGSTWPAPTSRRTAPLPHPLDLRHDRAHPRRRAASRWRRGARSPAARCGCPRPPPRASQTWSGSRCVRRTGDPVLKLTV